MQPKLARRARGSCQHLLTGIEKQRPPGVILKLLILSYRVVARTPNLCSSQQSGSVNAVSGQAKRQAIAQTCMSDASSASA